MNDKKEFLKMVEKTGNTASDHQDLLKLKEEQLTQNYRQYTLLSEQEEEEEGGKLFVQEVKDRQKKAALIK